MNVRRLLSDRFRSAFTDATGQDTEPLIQTSGKPEFGDYQANGAMAAAKKLSTSPRALAESVVARVDLDGIAEKLEIAGPGFINIHLDSNFLSARLTTGQPLIRPLDRSDTVVIDYYSPNLAKEMHIGHIRTTVIGDTMARIMEALGHRVTRQNHVGDWGTQFGMLLTYLDEAAENTGELKDLEVFYRAAKARFDEDEQFAERSRLNVVALQTGDAHARTQWRKFIDVSLSHCQAIYDRMNISLTMNDVRAESSYNDQLDDVIDELTQRGLISKSDGALCVFLDEFRTKQDKPLPVIVRKSDGGYLYSTTDLAAVRHRSRKLHADRVIYSVDARQILHFKQIFAVAEKAGFSDGHTSFEHQPFGAILGADGRPFKTREGEAVKLSDVLDEAEERALALISGKNRDLSESEKARIAAVVGIGAVKYAELSKNRTSDYVFDWDQMLSFDGNTAPYLQYAYTRIKSVFRRGEFDPESLENETSLNAVALDDPAERALALALTRLPEVVEQVAVDGFPHHLCAYLFDLAGAFMRFYEACPILNQPDLIRNSRLILSRQTAQTLKLGLELLGIDTVERM